MRIFETLLIILLANTTNAQKVPKYNWSKTYGGSQTELVGAFASVSLGFGRWAEIAVDELGNIFVATTTNSNNGDVRQNFGEEDVWVLGLNTNGDTLWTRVYGGSNSERVLRVKAAKGGGCYIVGHTRSNNGTFVGNMSASGKASAYIIRLDSSGNELWRKMYGGSDDDQFHDVIETSDGNLIACGESYSINGDLSGTTFSFNWAAKINPNNGNLIWSRRYQGPDAASNNMLENLFRLTELSDNSILMVGYTTPDFNDFAQDRVNMVKIDLNGNFIWTKKIGAFGGGDYPSGILPTDDGGYFLSVRLTSQIGGTGDASNYHGGPADFWLVKLNGNGDIIFEKNYGGSDLDVPYAIAYDSNQNIYMAGLTRSTNFEASRQGFGLADYWLIKINQDGDTLYTKRFGGSANDFCSAMALSPDGKILYLIGGTDSNDGMIQGFKGARDLWLLNLEYESSLSIQQINNLNKLKIFPNPNSGQIFIEPLQGLSYVVITDITGRQVAIHQIIDTSPITMADLENGLYFFKIFDANNHLIFTQKLIMKK